MALNEVQLWVGSGCPDGVVEGHTHKTTALALHNRGLAKISRKGGTWSATITGAGACYLKHGTTLPTNASF